MLQNSRVVARSLNFSDSLRWHIMQQRKRFFLMGSIYFVNFFLGSVQRDPGGRIPQYVPSLRRYLLLRYIIKGERYENVTPQRASIYFYLDLILRLNLRSIEESLSADEKNELLEELQ